MLGTVLLAGLALLAPQKTPIPIDQGLQAVIALADPSHQVELPPLHDAAAGAKSVARLKTVDPSEGSETLGPSPSYLSLVMKVSFPLLILSGILAGVTLFRRKRIFPRSIQVLESVTVGRGRSLVIAEVAGKRLLIGSSEAGISLLSDDIPLDQGEHHSQLTANSLTDQFGGQACQPSGLLGRLRRQKRQKAESFDSHLAHSTVQPMDEGEDLRAKLAARLGGKAA